MEYKALIFDFDYTLGDCTKGIVQCVEYASDKMEWKMVPVQKVRKAVGMTLENTYHYLTGDETIAKAKEFTELFKVMADKVMTECAVFLPYVKETLEELYRAGIPIGIVTTKYRFRIEGILRKLGAEKFIREIIGADNVAVEKPDPEGLLRMIAGFGLEKKEVLYVGDSIIDAKTAQNAGVDFGGVTTGTTGKEEFLKYPGVIVMEDIRPVITMIRRKTDGEGESK